jgi:hypothetical protein
VVLVRQPPGSQLCSQAALATVLGLTLEEVIRRAGFGRLGEWSMQQVDPRVQPPCDAEGWIRTPRPGVVAVCVTIPPDPADQGSEVGHTIVWDGSQFLDPADGYTGPVPDYGWVVKWTLEITPSDPGRVVNA